MNAWLKFANGLFINSGKIIGEKMLAKPRCTITALKTIDFKELKNKQIVEVKFGEFFTGIFIKIF